MRFRVEPRRVVFATFVLAALAASVPIATLVHAGRQPKPVLPAFEEDSQTVGEPELPAAVEQKRLAVLDELQGLPGHPWAGSYFHGDGEGMNVTLVLAPKAGAATWWRGCLGLYGAEHGDVLPRADGTLEIGLPPGDEFLRFPGELRPVRWGERRYLVEPSEFIDFVNEMHAGWEPRDDRFGRFLLAEGDEARPASGLPDLPPEFLRLVRSEPLNVHVLAVERVPEPEPVATSPPADPTLDAAPLFCQQHYRLTLDRGTESGLVPGIRLDCDDTCGYESAHVVRSDAGRAHAEMSVYDSGCDGEPPPDRTWIFSTGAFRPSN